MVSEVVGGLPFSYHHQFAGKLTSRIPSMVRSNIRPIIVEHFQDLCSTYVSPLIECGSPTVNSGIDSEGDIS